MACSLLFKIVTLCGIFYSNTKTNDIVAATFNSKNFNDGNHITFLTDATYGKCFPEFLSSQTNHNTVNHSLYKKDNNYLIIDKTLNLNSKCEDIKDIKDKNIKRIDYLTAKLSNAEKSGNKKLAQKLRLRLKKIKALTALKAIHHKIKLAEKSGNKALVARLEKSLIKHKRSLILSRNLEHILLLKKEIARSEKIGNRNRVTKLKLSLSHFQKKVNTLRSVIKLEKSIRIIQRKIRIAKKTGNKARVAQLSKILDKYSVNLNAAKHLASHNRINSIKEEISKAMKIGDQKKVKTLQIHLDREQKLEAVKTLKEAKKSISVIQNKIQNAKKKMEHLQKSLTTSRQKLINAKRDAANFSNKIRVAKLKDQLDVSRKAIVTAEHIASDFNDKTIKSRLDKSRRDIIYIANHISSEDGDDDDDDDDDWKKHVHPSLHHHVKEFLKHDFKGKVNDPSLRHLRNKVKEWWNDHEKDDEHDIKRMKHIFTKIRKH